MKKRLRVLVFSTLSLCFWFSCFPQFKVFAEESTRNIGAAPYIYEVPLSEAEKLNNDLQDKFSWWPGDKKESEKLFVTGDGILIENYRTTDNSDKSVKIEFTAYNSFVPDALVEIYDKQGRLVRFEKIDGHPSPEGTWEAVQGLWGVGADLVKGRQILNISDPRNNTQESKVGFTLNQGERANITASSDNVFLYNAVKTALNIAELAIDIQDDTQPASQKFNSLKEYFKDKQALEELALDFVKDLKFQGSKTLYLDSLLQINLTDPSSSLEKLQNSEVFSQLLSDLALYIAKEASKTYINTTLESVSDAFVDFFAKKDGKSTFGVLAKVLKGTFYISKSANIYLNTVASSSLYKSKIQPMTIALTADLKEQGKPQPSTQPNSNQFSQNEFLHNQLSSITQGNSSHIGSAAYFIGRSPINDSISDQQFSGATNSNVGENARFPIYTSGQPLQTPVDIVLSWDQARTRLDLDSHLTGPATSDPNSTLRFHTYFGATGNLSAAPFANLYRDSIPDPGVNPNGLIGVEQTRLGAVQPQGIYRFYVQNYSEYRNTTAGQSNGTSGLSNSGAKVEVFNAGTTIPTFDPNNPNVQGVGTSVTGAIPVPPNQQGNAWYVFQLDSRTGILRRVNTFNPNIVPPNQVPAFGEPRP